MKEVDSSLTSLLTGTVTTFAYCVKIQKSDGTYLYFTGYDKNLAVDGQTYVASGGIDLTKIKVSTGGTVDNVEIHGLIDGGSISKQDIEDGVLVNSIVNIFSVDYTNPPAVIDGTNVIHVFAGLVSNVYIKDVQWIVEVRGHKQRLKQRVGISTSKSCRADLGDSKCQVVMTSYTETGTVTSVSGKKIATNITFTNEEHYKEGRASISTKGYLGDVSFVSGGVVTVMEKVRHSALVGESITVTAGCDKSLNTCRVRYNNVVNFQGEPHAPVSDEWLSGVYQSSRP